ncbi:hypothetical protein LAWI1_G006953, partial [Lachnellula willkommii]
MATFPLFTSFPPEIHSMILSSCPPNDATCLALTWYFPLSPPIPQTLLTTASKNLYALSPSKRPICLSTNDNIPPHCTLSMPDTIYFSRGNGYNWCHVSSYQAALTRTREAGLPAPRNRRTCTARRWTATHSHCECFEGTGELWWRLRGWMPEGLRYCGECGMFTVRKRGHRGVCYHGNPKPRSYKGNLWTHRSRNGAFGPKLWKMWVNNAAMD